VSSRGEETTSPAVSTSSRGEETTSPARLEVKLSAASGKPVTVGFVVTGGTATKGKDYAFLQDDTLTFESGETTKEIVVDIKNHGIYDDDKTLEIALKNPKNAVLGETTVYSYSILNKNPTPTVAFTSKNQVLRKKGGNAVMTIRLSGVSGKDVTVPFTVSGTARDQKDYQVMTQSPVIIKAGMTTGTITIALMNNESNEGTKTIVVTLGTPVNATPGESVSHSMTLLDADTLPRIAIMPFTNDSNRKYAGEIMVLLFLNELIKGKHFTVIEPGLIIEKLLEYRIIMYEGTSLSDANLIAGELNADLILTGRVLDYQENATGSGRPKVGFSLLLINRKNQRVVWSSSSRNEGDDDVYLFDWGRIHTAHALAAEMASAIGKMIE
jgi:hypothetical protein